MWAAAAAASSVLAGSSSLQRGCIMRKSSPQMTAASGEAEAELEKWCAVLSREQGSRGEGEPSIDGCIVELEDLASSIEALCGSTATPVVAEDVAAAACETLSAANSQAVESAEAQSRVVKTSAAAVADAAEAEANMAGAKLMHKASGICGVIKPIPPAGFVWADDAF